ncbi:MAG: Jag N-terminal domain-containing protein [Actinobacteria bacterium]|nr:Jag N-terminal domain-containing protein [Actinomycetota bacterium]
MTRMIEKRASTVKDATAAALRELGVGPDEATVEVLNEGRRGLFSGRSRAHVRVTVREDRSNGETPVGDTLVTEPDSRAEDGTAGLETDDTSGADRLAELNEEADLAADFVEGLLDILELPGDIEIEVDENQAFVNVVEVGSGLLIGRRGATLEALQELVRAATQRHVERRSHVRIDIEGYRQRQLDKMKDRCREGIAQVRETGEPFRLEAMDAFERKVMHDLVARTGGVTSASEGVEPRRRVVVYAAEE